MKDCATAVLLRKKEKVLVPYGAITCFHIGSHHLCLMYTYCSSSLNHILDESTVNALEQQLCDGFVVVIVVMGHLPALLSDVITLG